MVLAQKSPEINPCTYWYLSFDKGGKNGAKKPSSINVAEKIGKLNVKKKNEIRTLPNTIHKINTKWIKDLNVRPETIKFLEENIGRSLSDINQKDPV